MLVAIFSTNARADVSFEKDVKPLLARCHACHGALKQQSGLRLDLGRLIRQGGDSGQVVIPGNAAESPLVQAISAAEGASPMPPEGEGTRLTADQIATIRAWIDAGAIIPDDEPEPLDPRAHWSFQTPRRSKVPEPASASWIRNPIDAFIAAEHQRHGVRPASPAERHTLLRRVYLDLIGLPPTREETEAFLADTSEGAYERVVQRLLDSPRHGERWGRHWMDVWRYGDWAGYAAEIRESQYHLWRWRDWIVESLNADRPYDQMIVEMLAGDEIAPQDPQVLRATGYLGRNWYKFSRNVWLDNTIEHCGKAFLGLTFNCARCHDHKYDPVGQDEYFQLRAIFEPYDVRYDRVPGQEDVVQAGVARVFDKQLDQQTYLFVRGNEARPDTTRALPASIPAVFGATLKPDAVPLPIESYYPALAGFQLDEARAKAKSRIETAESALAKSQHDLERAHARLAALAKGVAPLPRAEVVLADPFDRQSDDVWEQAGGVWNFRDGRVTQSEVSTVNSALVAKRGHPRDFRATMKFKTTGGAVYKSVGLSFDYVDAGNVQSVYLSAYEAGPKVQVCHTTKGQAVYPNEGAVPVPVKVGDEQTLEVAVRGQLVNVWVNGEFKLAHETPLERRAGRFTVWTFDATAELDEVRVETLPDEVPLAAAGSTTPPPPTDPALLAKTLEQTVARSDAAVRSATARLLAVNAERESLERRVASERAKYGLDPGSDLAERSRAASLAERLAALASAESARTDAEMQLAVARDAPRPSDEKSAQAIAAAQGKLDAAVKAVEAARAKSAEESSSYTPLGEVYPSHSTGRRLALARWIASGQNPLTARVAVNHIWLRHFGKPLVPTVFDFGRNGKPPTHPELLDWLAVELMENGWQFKHLHRLIVTSSTYQQASAYDHDPAEANAGQAGSSESPPVAREATVREVTAGRFADPRVVDPDNHLLWKMPARRIEAEVVRDSLLHVAGSLDTTMGGPEIDQGQGQAVPRRSLYFRHGKEKEMTFTKLFDGPGVSECYKRDESIVPQQSLALVNSPLAKGQSRVLARKLTDTHGAGAEPGNVDRFLRAAFWQVLTREPTEQELAACRAFLVRQAELLDDQAKLQAAAVGEKAAVAASEDPRQRARENLVLVLMNHNDFVTVR